MAINVLKKKILFSFFLGKESTFYVVLIQNSLSLETTTSGLRETTTNIKRCLSEKLARIPNTKLVKTTNLGMTGEENISSETLEVYLLGKGELITLLELLSKRLETLDLISVMLELQRTVSSRNQKRSRVKIRENLSRVPRFQKT